jgi:hypothetical protein
MNLHRLTPSRDELVDAGFVLALTIVGLYAFQQSYGGAEYLVVGGVCAALGLLVGHIGNRTSTPVLAMVPVLFLAYVVVGGAIALRGGAIAGFLPSLDTARDALRMTVLGWKQLLTTVPPVGSSGSLLALPAFCGFIAAGLGLIWARRVNALVPPALLPAAVLVTGLLFGLKSPVSVLVHGAAFIGLLVMMAAVRYGRGRRVVIVGERPVRRLLAGGGFAVGAAALGLMVAPVLPFADVDDRVTIREVIEPPFDPAVYPSPLSSYREYIKRYEDDTLFTITGLPEGAPIRLATMDDFDGVVWRVTGGGQTSPGASGYFERVGSQVRPDFPGEVITVTVEIQQWSQVWLPTVGEVLEIRFGGPRARALADAFRYNRATDTGATQGVLLRSGDRYEMEVVVPASVAAATGESIIDLQGKNSDNAVLNELVGWATPLVRSTERSERPAKLADELSAAGIYSDGNVDEGHEPSVGGHGSVRLRYFIGQPEPVGNAEQYASALALMLRGEAVPSRVMMGFQPEQWSDGPIEITGKDAEAWTEVPYTDVGWVTFDPTPDRTKLEPTQEPVARPQPERNTQVPPPPPILAEDPRSEPASERDAEEQDDPEEVLTDTSDGLPGWVALVAAVVGAPMLIGTSIVAAILLLKHRRRRRRRRAAVPHLRIAGGWLELIDHAVDHGRPMPASATRREAGAFVSPGAVALAYRADAAVWGGGEPTDAEVEKYWADIVSALKEMNSSAGLSGRVQAMLSLRSYRVARDIRRAQRRNARAAQLRDRQVRLRGFGRASAPKLRARPRRTVVEIEAQAAASSWPAPAATTATPPQLPPPQHHDDLDRTLLRPPRPE